MYGCFLSVRETTTAEKKREVSRERKEKRQRERKRVGTKFKVTAHIEYGISGADIRRQYEWRLLGPCLGGSGSVLEL